MNKEQNIDDILKLLKNSYDSDPDPTEKEDIPRAVSKDISHDELQSLLREKFAANEDSTASDKEQESPEYKPDENFLEEENEALLEAVSELIDEEEPTLEEEPEDDGLPPFDLADEVIEESAMTEVTDEVQKTEALEASEKEDEPESAEMPEATEEAEAKDEAVEEQELFSNDSGQLALFEGSAQDELEEDDGEISDDDADVDEAQIVLDFGDADDEPEAEMQGAEESNIDTSFLGLMLEVGDNVAIGKNVSTERIDIYNERQSESSVADIAPESAFGFDGEEYSDPEQADDVIYSYKRDKKFTFLRLVACGAFTLLIALLELLPMLPIELHGILDHTKYPTVYLLLGIQLLVLAGVFAWRELWSGLKRAFCFKSDLWSLSALMVSTVLVYEIVLTVLSPASLPHTFGTVAALYIFVGLLCEYLSVSRELKSFEVYSCDSIKYTFETEPLANSAAEKMYRGGVSGKINIFEPREVSFPKGYFFEVNRTSEPDRLINSIITPMILASAALWVVSMMLGVTLVQSLETFMLSLAALCPVSLFASRTLPITLASKRLYDRESAIASVTSAKKYASCDIMVFRDSHLFRPSRPEDNGIVIYDKKNTKRIIEYLNSIYSNIGGPMKDLFADAAQTQYEPRLRRIARNGVEAVINKQSVVLGDIQFQSRYGITFPERETARDGEGIICLSIDGVPSAKLCLRYATEPIFEMIVSKMEENGIKCAIETYDPVINSAFVAASRKEGKAPINVVHKNVTDYYSEMPENVEGNTGLVACSSRLKLVECVVWCKKIFAARRAAFVVHCVTLGVTLAALLVLLLLGYADNVDQYAVLLIQAIGLIPTLAVIFASLPSKQYFTVEREETEKEIQGNREDTDE